MKPQDEKQASVLKDLTKTIEVKHSKGYYIFLFYCLRDILSHFIFNAHRATKADKQLEMTGTIEITHQ